MRRHVSDFQADNITSYDKERLLANGDRWERAIARNISLDAPYR